MQFDFEAQTLCTVAKGKQLNSFPFDEIDAIDSDDGPQFSVTTVSAEEGTLTRHEFEADSLEEKNTIFRLVSLILAQRGAASDTVDALNVESTAMREGLSKVPLPQRWQASPAARRY